MARNSAQRFWDIDFTCMFAARMCASCVFMMLNVVLVAYAIDELGVSPGGAGLAVGVFTVGMIASRLFTGRFLDVLGRRRMMLLGGALCIATTACYLLPLGFAGLVLVRVAHGAAYGIWTSTTMVIATSLLPPDRLGEGLGFFSLTSTLSVAIGPVAGALAIGWFGYGGLFALGVLLTAVSLVLPSFIGIVEPDRAELAAFEQAPLLDRYISRSAIPISILIGIASACISCPNSFMNAYCAFEGIAGFSVLYFVVYSAVMCVARPLLGRMVDKCGDNRVVYPSLALFFGAFFLLWLDLGAVGIVLAAILAGLGFGGLFPSYQLIVTRLADSVTIGVVNSTFFVFSDFGLSVGPMLGGIAVSLAGYPGMFGACALMALAMGTLYHALHGRSASRMRAEGRGHADSGL